MDARSVGTLLLSIAFACRSAPGADAPETPAGVDPPAACVPRTCSAAGAECGAILDGCGGTLACGSCAEGTACQASGEAGVCAPDLPTASASWTVVLPADGRFGLGGLAGDPQGDAFVAWYAGRADDAIRLARISEGSPTLLRRFGVDGGTRSVFRPSPNLLWKPGGSLFLGVTAFVGFSQDTYADLGAGRRTSAQTVELREDGTFVRTVLTCCTAFFESTSWLEDIDAQGNLLVGHWSTGPDWTKLVRADGSELLLWHDSQGSSEPTLPSVLPQGCFSPRFTPDGSIVCGGRGPSVAKVDLEGRIAWNVNVGVGYGVAGQVGVAADGTIVAAGYFAGTGTFGADRLDAERAGFVLAIEPDGAPRWARQVTPSPQALAMGPEGQTAFLLSQSFVLDGPVDVLYVDPDGTFRWRSVAEAQRIAFAGDEVVVAGGPEKGPVVVQGLAP